MTGRKSAAPSAAGSREQSEQEAEVSHEAAGVAADPGRCKISARSGKSEAWPGDKRRPYLWRHGSRRSAMVLTFKPARSAIVPPPCPTTPPFPPLFRGFFPAVVFGLGACVGSFLNVCIYRIPAGQSVVTPRSHCACGAPIAWYDNLPIFSWFILRGHARCCGRPFSFRYPCIEVLTALVFTACWCSFPPAKRCAACCSAPP